MAGRPAKARSGGLTGAHYASIAFAFITVAALGGFIFQLTKVKEADQRAAKADRQLEKYGRPPAWSGSYYENEASNRNTAVFSVMADDLNKMAELIAGTKDTVGPTLTRRANEMLSRIAADKRDVVNPGDTLLTAIENLDRRLTEEFKTNQELTSNLRDEKEQTKALTGQLKSSRDEFEAEIADLKGKVDQTVADFGEKLEEKENQLVELVRDLELRDQEILQLKRENDRQTHEQQVVIDRQEGLINKLQGQVQGLKGSFDAQAILRKADGRILRAIPGSEVVYINLGIDDNIKAGMGFEVYSQAGTVEQTLRGKASLEVVTLMENTAECRVTRSQPGHPIIEGDIVVNITYEQKRQPKFVIRGQFDLDFDGQVDTDGTARIRDIIRQWGGQIAPELDETVDFVVIGTAPEMLAVGPEASDIVRDQEERRMLARVGFDDLKTQAKSMYIPILTQNQFLFLTGYAGDALVRERE